MTWGIVEYLFHHHSYEVHHEHHLSPFIRNIMTALEQLQADIDEDKVIKAQGIALFAVLMKQIADLVAAAAAGGTGVDPAALAALSTQLQAQNKGLADAIAASTTGGGVPPAPPTTPTVTPTVT